MQMEKNSEKYMNIDTYAEQDNKERPSSGVIRFIIDLLETVILSALLFLGINAVSARIRVDGYSMEPTFSSGEFVIVNKLAYKLGSPKYGDVIVFHYPRDPEQEYIKRIIGLPGDSIKIENGQLFINDIDFREPYIAEEPNYQSEWIVPEDSLFVLGDNRNKSSDSHNWGAVPMDYVIGKEIRLDRIVEIIKRAEYYLEEIPEPGKILETPQGAEIASWIDHTLLKPEATAEQVRYLCEEAQEFQFASVCVNPSFVPLVSGLLVNSGIDICAVVGFPLGATLATQKIFETLSCMDSGATEIDMVMNIGALKGQAYGMVLNEIQSIAQVVHNQRGVLKVILEMSFLTKKEKIMACLLSEAAGADFVKTSTGFGPGGAKLEDVDLMNRIVGKSLSIKAAGGIRDCETAKAMIVSGASRIGTSSGVKIVQEATA